MRRKNIFLTISLIVLILCMTACGNAIPELSEQQQDQICEYAASLLLKYDKNYKPSVLDDQSIAEREEELRENAELKVKVEEQKKANALAEENKESERESIDDNSTSVTSEKTVQDIDEFLGLNGLSIEYADYVVCDSYPDDATENDWQGLCRATNGNKLVVFKFDIKNDTENDYSLNMPYLNTRFTFKVNGSLSKSAITTFIGNDFILYKGTIAPGETIQNVIIIELSEQDASNLSSVTMKMKINGNLSETTLF